MLVHPHLPRLRELRAWPSTSRATLAVALVGFALIFAVRVLDGNPANAEGALYVIPVGVLALRFGLRGGALGALLALALTVAWGLIDSVHFTTFGYATRALTIVAARRCCLGASSIVVASWRRRSAGTTTPRWICWRRPT